MSKSLGWIFSLVILTSWAFVLFSWVGNYFVEAELPRLGNDQLLNNLKEGIVIIEEDSSIIKFMNETAKKLMTEFSDNFSISVLDENNVFEKQQEMFAFVDMADIFDCETNYDY